MGHGQARSPARREFVIGANRSRNRSEASTEGHRSDRAAVPRDEFVFVGVTARWGRDTALLTGSCEIRDSAETASVLAVLDATNRWIAHAK